MLFIVDLDGTLLDSERCLVEVYAEAMKEHGASVRLKDLSRAMVGKHYSQFLREFFPEGDPSLYAQIHERKNALYLAGMAQMKINEPLIRLLRTLKLQNSIALATTASRPVVDTFLNRFDLAALFDFTISGSDVKCRKPDPECYFKVLEHFQCNSNQAIAIEDSSAGFEAATRAGISCLTVRISPGPSAKTTF